MRNVFVFAAVVAIAAFPSAVCVQAQTSAAPVAKTTSIPAGMVLAPYSSSDTDIGVLLDDPASRAVLEKYMPSLTKGGQANMARAMTLKGIQGYSGGLLSDQVLAKIDTDLAKLGPKIQPAPSANVDEAKVAPYTLPDPLVLSNGKPVRDAQTWWKKRRPEILAMFETQEYGRAPGRPASERFEISDRGTPAFDGAATRKQIVIHLLQDPAAPQIHVVEYVPAAAKKRVPMLLVIGFVPPALAFADTGIHEGGAVPDAIAKAMSNPEMAKQMRAMQMDIKPFLDAGIGIAYFNYAELEPDSADGYAKGIRYFYEKGDNNSRAPDSWGAIAAWGWGMSRVQDYLEADKAVDAKRVAIYGASRLGKTVLWAAARDQRFAAVIACCSGEGGAALMRRKFGGTIASSAATTGYWFARNYQNYANKESSLPMDTHELLALIAPRPVLLQTGSTDYSGDPKGEFLAAAAATPVYGLLGKEGLDATTWPPAAPNLTGNIAYDMHVGGHGPLPSDWPIYLNFLEMHLHPDRPVKSGH